jgi:hypothetical protein
MCHKKLRDESIVPMMGTVKAPNFGPHGNFGPFLARSVASLNEFCAKNEQNQSCKLKVSLQLSFHSFFCKTRFDNRKPF